MLHTAMTNENARACACARFFFLDKTLKMALNVCKQKLRRFGAFRNFTRFFFYLKLTGRILTLIYDKYEWEMTFCYEDMIMSWFSENFTKWRLDDVISQGQGWKPCFALSLCL